MKPWLVLIPLALLVFLNRAPGTYVGECDSFPITFEVVETHRIPVCPAGDCQTEHTQKLVKSEDL